jgi:hypothetical protein
MAQPRFDWLPWQRRQTSVGCGESRQPGNVAHMFHPNMPLQISRWTPKYTPINIQMHIYLSLLTHDFQTKLATEPER